MHVCYNSLNTYILWVLQCQAYFWFQQKKYQVHLESKRRVSCSILRKIIRFSSILRYCFCSKYFRCHFHRHSTGRSKPSHISRVYWNWIYLHVHAWQVPLLHRSIMCRCIILCHRTSQKGHKLIGTRNFYNHVRFSSTYRFFIRSQCLLKPIKYLCFVGNAMQRLHLSSVSGFIGAWIYVYQVHL
jgi:hypothetical protein